jgi:rfaE bifunctional protein kinase chain/domain
MRKTGRPRLVEIFGSFKDLSVMVVGDFALDVYWYADMTRSELSRETPHHTRPVTSETYSPGASGNICWNVSDLGVKAVFAVTVIGDDWRGQILAREMKRNGACLDHVVTSPDVVTSTYIKPILCGFDSQQEAPRLDFMNRNPLPKALEDRLIGEIQAAVPKVDAVIVEDQMVNNGVVTGRVRDAIVSLAGSYPDKTFVADSRERVGLFRNMVLKPNRLEAVRAVSPSMKPEGAEVEELKKIGLEMVQNAKRPIYITLGERGALLVTESAQQQIPAAPTTSPIDPVGAGDTFISALAASLAGGADFLEAGIIANLAAGVTVEKLNTTGTASQEEILGKFADASGSEAWKWLIG